MSSDSTSIVHFNTVKPNYLFSGVMIDE